MSNPVHSFFKQLELFLAGFVNGIPTDPKEDKTPVVPQKPQPEEMDRQSPSPSGPLMVTIGDQLVSYELVRNAKRKYLALEIGLDGTLVVRAPRNVTIEYVEQVLKTKADWILERLKEQSSQRPVTPLYESDWDCIRDDAILIDNDWVPLVFEKSPRRRSVSMVVRNNTVIVHIPARQSIKEVRNWVIRQRVWIEKHYRQQKQVSETRADTREQFFKNPQLTLLGKEYEVIKKVEKGKDRIEGYQILLFFEPINIDDQKVFEGKLVAVLKDFARQALEKEIRLVMGQIPLIGRQYRQMRLSSAKTRWGSCSSRGVICLNWRLVLLDLELVRYVICHELAHLAQMNHSKNFWQLVGTYYPNYKEAEKRLKAISLKDFPLG